MQWNEPREGEAGDVAEWSRLLTTRGEGPIHIDGPTRIGPQGESQIDMCVAPATVVHTYRTRKAWKTGLSDHAMLFCDSSMDARTGRPDTLTPWMFKALPAEAHADLRRRYRT